MYHQQPPPQGAQPFSSGPRPPHQPPPNQHQARSNTMGFQFPRPTQLPDELESALAIRGARDMDHRQIDHMNRPTPHQNHGSGLSQHGSFGSNPISLPADNQPGNQRGVDWSSYQPPTKLFAGPPPTASHQSQQHQGPQQPQSGQAGARLPSWTSSITEAPSTQTRRAHGVSGDRQSLYTPESAGSILASFGLSNEDLEVLSHYPDDQLTPDTLPFILRDIQINKSGKTVAPPSSSSFSHSIHDMPLPPSRSSPLTRSCSPEVPSLLTVTQTAGKVIDYGHASRTKDDSSTRETFKREPLSSERTVKMYPASSSSSSAPKVDKTERRQVRLEHAEPSKHGDSDYRRESSDQITRSHSSGKEFPSSPKSRDQDYRRDGAKQRLSSEARSEASSRRSLSSSSGSKPHSSSKKLPTPTMISDFSAVSPKVYPHTCSLCHILCDQEEDWVDHVNTVSHTAACRDLRNKYPDWKPNLPSRSGRYGGQALWDPKDGSPSHSISHSRSRSPSPPSKKQRVDSRPYKPQRRPYSPHRYPRHHLNTDRRDQFEHRRSPSYLVRTSSSSREHWTERRERGSTASSSRSAATRPRDDSAKGSTDTSRGPSSSSAGHSSKHRPSQPSVKSLKGAAKPETKTTKTSAKPPPAAAAAAATKKKKKKKTAALASQDPSVADRLVYLTGIPEDASEQEVTDLVSSFGNINNVILMPCSEDEKGQGQKASVCMVRAEDAQALATSTNLSIREQQITALVAKKPEAEPSTDASSSKPSVEQDSSTGNEADQKTTKCLTQKGRLLITGLPESGWSVSDIIELVQPFGTPSDIILATQIGKVLVSVPDVEVAQEMVKVHTFVPAKVKDCEVKMFVLKQNVSFGTPVALYNLLMGSVDPLENPARVGWASLLVISNVPDTPSGSSEVQKLVRRFGTVIKTLVLNSMVICKMATPAMALSVYKRFQTFPCIIQSNPLFFSRKPEATAPRTQAKVISAYQDSAAGTPANGKGSQTAADEEEAAHQEASESPAEGTGKDGDGGDDETKTGKDAVKAEASEENESQEVDREKGELAVCDSSAAPEAKPEADTMERSGTDTVTEAAEGSAVTSASGKEAQVSSEETAVPELPKVTQAMVNALLVECRTRTTSHPAAPPSGEQEKEQKPELDQKAAEETKEQNKNQTEEEGGVKRQEREKKEKETRKDRRERERERRGWEKEERAKREREWTEKSRRDRERRDEERREWERKERERRERKRAHGDSLSGSRSSSRSEGSKQSYRRGERRSVKADSKTERELDDFPFNLSDFVTVDEVGEVADLQMETSEEAPPTSVQQDTPEVTPMEVTATPEKTDEQMSEPGCATETKSQTSDGSALPDVTPSVVPGAAAVSQPPAPQSEPTPSHTPAADLTPEPDLTADSTPEDEHLPIAAPAASAAAVVTAERSQDEKEEVESNKQEQQREVEVKDSREPRDAAAETGKPELSEDPTSTEEECVKTEIPRKTEHSLPPFDPTNPVGMEFLVPKTGFFCKACSRFFSGAKEAEINHCKTRKHYENLQKYLQTTKQTSVSEPDCS